VGNEYDIEQIEVKDVDELFELPSGNSIMTMKVGKPPIRAGYTNTFTDAELDLLPDIQKELAKAEEVNNENKLSRDLDKILAEFDDNESDHSAGDGSEAETSDAEAMMPPQKKFKGEELDGSLASKNTSGQMDSYEPKKNKTLSIDQEVTIKNLRCKKIDAANEIMRLNNKIEAVRMMVNLEQNIMMKTRLNGQVQKIASQITQKKQEMSTLDAELAKYGQL